ncbi:MAG: hypothetical protein KAH38_05690 [Candidatus Hydrogenedentes bacterium]|nr:hypothetical protein [Candidatus Hydrogenedentota bacterium]
MDSHAILLHMLQQLLKEMEIVSSQGAGYYTCVPFAQRYNKLLGQARTIHDENNSLMDTFQESEEHDPKDPADKSKVLLGIRVEISQLIAYLECFGGEESK